MTLWLVHRHGSRWMDHHHPATHYRTDDGKWEHRIDLDENPAPAVAADGICGGGAHHVWLEEDGVAARVIYDQKYPGTPAEDITDRQAPTVRVGSSGGHFQVDDDGREPPRELPDDGTGKPPYRVPLMAELPPYADDAPVVASTFSGGGGSCLGYRLAGFRVAWANEFVAESRDTYRANFPDTVLDGRDIREVKADEILDALGMKAGELDLFDGSPPCQSFSTAGKRQKGWGKVVKHGDGSEQRSDNLFPEYARLLEGLQPRSFVAENVSGLVKGVAKGYFKEILAMLRGAGYRVEAALVDAQWCGVPQQRVRLIFQGMREDLGIDPAFPAPLPYRYSVREALWDLTPGMVAQKVMVANHVEAWRSPDKPSPTITTKSGHPTNYSGEILVDAEQLAEVEARPPAPQGRKVHSDEPAPTILACHSGWSDVIIEDDAWRLGPKAVDRVDRLKQGESAADLPEGGPFSLSRLDWEQPASTVLAADGAAGSTNQIHPVERRRLSIAELRRIGSFPDDFVLAGTYAQQWARIGNAVPPLMMFRVASAVRDALATATT